MINDIRDMHTHFYGLLEYAKWIDDPKLKYEFLKFRLNCLDEEVKEALEAFEERDADGVVDAIIDTMVFALGTLELFGVNTEEAWEEVHSANMTKRVGIKEGRDNPYNLPDLTKPSGWKSPSHEKNLGTIKEALVYEAT